MYSIHDPDRYGFYLVADGKKFYNKLECIFYCQEKRLGFNWHFNDFFYDRLDWTKEPIADIQHLYDERARELRLKYDYLILHLSGGYDSGNVLETFLRNNIKIDEILIRGPFKGTKADAALNTVENTYAEVELIAWPLAKLAKEKYQPHIRITVVDTKELVARKLVDVNDWFERGYHDLNFGGFFKNDPSVLDTRYQHMRDRGITVAHITGGEKPMFYIDHRKLCCVFEDERLHKYSPLRDQNNLSNFQEPFYWAPDTGKMIIKQCHSILNYINNSNDPMKLATELMLHGGRKIDQWMSLLIYPKRTLPTWFCDKTSNTLMPQWDNWFFNNHNEEFYQIWKKSIEYIGNKLDTIYFKKRDYRQGFQRKVTKGRIIGEILQKQSLDLMQKNGQK